MLERRSQIFSGLFRAGEVILIPIWGERYLNSNEGFWARPPACGGRARLTGGRPERAGRQPKRAYMNAIGISLLLYRPGLPMRLHATLLVADHFLYPSRFVPPNPLLK